jgi:hypothetical protein
MRRAGFVLLLLLLPLRAEETNDFGTIAKAGLELVAKHGHENVLMVFDIDNTLLTMDQDLGGDAWFNWQADLLKANPNSPQLVARDFAGLLRVQGILFALSGMHPPEKTIPALVRSLQDTGATLFALSSRGPEYYSSTMRVLAENGYDLTRTSTAGHPGAYVPFREGISEDEAKRFRIGTPRPVMFQSGVFLAAGQHKGAILRAYWKRHGMRHKALLFADDHKKHLDRVKEAFADEKIELKLFRYSRTDAAVERFRKSDKQEVAERWRTLRAALDAVLGKAEPAGANR